MVFFNLELPAQQVHNLVFTENPLPAEVLAQLQAGLAVLDEGLPELLFGKKSRFNQHFAQFLFYSHGFYNLFPLRQARGD